MIGIKGVGMTMLAQFLAAKGCKISGSDLEEKYMTDEVLHEAGIKVIEKFDEKNVPEKVDLVIYSTAYNKENNPELKFVLDKNIKVLSYAESLAEVFNKMYGIAITGTHGKTTTSAWLGYVLSKAGKDPSVMVGARVEQFKGASLLGKSDNLVVELDEYQNKFQYFLPQVVLLNNIEYDHPDFFPTFEDYKKIFVDFIKKIPVKGFLVVNLDDPEVRKIAHVNSRAKVISYAIQEAADYVAYDIKNGPDGKQYFKIKLGVDENGEVANSDFGDFSIQLSGKHNIQNALAVIATCIELNIDLVLIRKHLEGFTGTARRAEIMGEYKSTRIIDDYAHHPTEIKSTLEGLRQQYKDKNMIVVFHPHTFTRTKALLNEFANSFDEANEIIILDIYGSAREEQGGVSSKDLVDLINEKQERASHIPTLEKCEEYLRENIKKNDLVILMGAGDVFRIGDNLIK